MMELTPKRKLALFITAMVAAGACAVAPIVIATIEALDDVHYPARAIKAYRWDCGPSPTVVVDLEEGDITVSQSEDGSVAAILKPFAVTRVSQAAADAALGDVAISALRGGDLIRIKTTLDPKVRVTQLKADIELRVPPDATLGLLTGQGSILIGKSRGGPYGASLQSSPVALKAVKARDLGGIYCGIEAEIASRPASPPTKLDLESRHGRVVVKGDHVLRGPVEIRDQSGRPEAREAR